MKNFDLTVSNDADSTDIAHACIDFNDKRVNYIGNKQRLDMLDNTKSAMKKANGKHHANISVFIWQRKSGESSAEAKNMGDSP